MAINPMVNTAKIRLLLVDDHPVMRMGLASLLSIEGDFDVVAQADDGPSAIELWRLHRPDVCVMDIMMEGMDGVETLRRLKRLHPDVRVLMLSSSHAPEDIAHAMEAGAAGYVQKNARRGDLTRAIRAVYSGETFVPGTETVKVDTANDTRGVSQRELEVLGLVRQGFTNAEIGRLMGISERTVRWHVASLMEKLSASDRAHAVARGFELGLLGVVTPGAVRLRGERENRVGTER